jgi:hypothetical protein
MAALLDGDSIANWDFRNNYVQNNVDPGGSFVRGASVLLAAGPPSLAQATLSRPGTPGFSGFNEITEDALTFAYPIGLVDNIGVAQSKGLQQIFEIGSDRRYFIPGRTVNSVNMSRVMFDGPSLMKVMYNDYYRAELPYNNPDTPFKTGSPDRTRPGIKLRSQPGFDHTFLNLGSDLFNRPIGLLMLVHNANDEGVAAVYLEYCFIQGHQMNINASSTLFAESIQAQFDRVVPINMNFERLFNVGAFGPTVP